MKARVTKTFRFEAAHHLPMHDGKCKNPHGHSYKVAVCCEGEIIDDPDNPKDGMVIDFADLKSFWKQFLEPQLDHKDLNETLGEPFSFATTAENIAKWICSMFLDAKFPVREVSVWETETSYATVFAGMVMINGG